MGMFDTVYVSREVLAARCPCGEYVERHVKFTDGVAGEVRAEPPRHEPGFFESSGGLDW